MASSSITTQAMFIDGAWVEGSGDDFVEGINPATEEIISKAPVATIHDLDAAVVAARRAFDDGPWPTMTAKERGAVLRRCAEIMSGREAELADLTMRENGWIKGPFSGVRGGIGFIRYCADFLDSYQARQNLLTIDASTRPGLPLGGGVAQREPIGVVGAIISYNAPPTTIPWKIGPALAMGNTVVMKPSAYTPMQAGFFAKAFEDAGLPPGVLNFVTEGLDASKALTTHPGVDMVSFTGSTEVGRLVMAQAAATVKRLVLALGGKSANIILDDVNLGEIMPRARQFLTIAGQGCSLQTRLLVHESIHDAFVEALCDELATIVVGNPADEGVAMGPLIRESQVERMERYVQYARDEGGTIAFGGGRPKHLDKGFFFEPTLITGLDNSSRVAQEEIFGPIAVVIPFRNEDDAVRIANDSQFGLAGGIQSADVQRAFNLAQRLRTGQVLINGGSSVMTPVGGTKQSGFGSERGEAGFHEFTQYKGISWPISKGAALGRVR